MIGAKERNGEEYKPQNENDVAISIIDRSTVVQFWNKKKV